MFGKTLEQFFTITITLIIAAQIILAPNIEAQSIESINDGIGGSGGSSTVQEDSNPGTTLFVLAGVAVAALLIYKFVFYKEKKSDVDEPGDSTITDSQSLLQQNILRIEENRSVEINKFKNELPVNLFLGLTQSGIAKNEKHIRVGLSYRF